MSEEFNLIDQLFRFFATNCISDIIKQIHQKIVPNEIVPIELSINL